MRVVHQRSTPHHGRIRLQDFDYSTSGSYYFTIVTAQREPLLGSISDGTMVRSVAGEAVLRVWNELPARFDALELDSFVVMPDHVHGIVWLTTTLADDAAGATSLIRVMRAFKSLSAREVNSQLNRSGAVWQRSYYERIVRNELELRRFREYIDTNPERWRIDDD